MQNIYHNNINNFFSQEIQDFYIPFHHKQSSFYSVFEQKFEDKLSIEFVCDQQLMSLNQHSQSNYLDFFKQQNQMEFYQSNTQSKQIQIQNPTDQIKTSNKCAKEDSFDKLSVKQSGFIKRPRKQINKKKSSKTFYEKNICRNIIRKSIRSIESGTYQTELKSFCDQLNFDLEEFSQIMFGNLEEITGPAALKQFLKPNDEVAKIFRKYLVWFLKQRYIREALKEGHMKDVNKYIEYKNSIILPMLR